MLRVVGIDVVLKDGLCRGEILTQRDDVEQPCLEMGEERLHRRIVQGAGACGHRLDESILLQELLKAGGGVLRP